MNDQNLHIFKGLNDHISTPTGLKGLVLASITAYEYRKMWARFVGSGVLAAISVTVIFPAFFYISSGLSDSNFYQYLSVFVEDSSLIKTFWSELLMSLVESIPALSVAVFLFAFSMFVWSVQKAILVSEKITMYRNRTRMIK